VLWQARPAYGILGKGVLKYAFPPEYSLAGLNDRHFGKAESRNIPVANAKSTNGRLPPSRDTVYPVSRISYLVTYEK
jgi:hypothetical protein